MEPASITLVRHGETEANAAEVWQGHGDSPLSRRGQRQVEAFGDRIREREFDVVVTSDLGRTVATAEATGFPLVLDKAWRELDMGEWDGMARAEIFANHSDLLAELRSGKDIRWGGAESYSEFVARIDSALEALASSLRPGQRALVVAHGGVIHAVVAGLLGFRDRPRPWPVGRITNTSLTTIQPEPRRLVTFNDSLHLGDDHDRTHRSSSSVTLVRHGQTPANVRGWWHGTTETDLTPTGEQQAAAVAAMISTPGRLVASPRLRARRTAEIIGSRHGLMPETDERLVEMDFGAWEGLTQAEIEERFPDEWAAVQSGRDLPRGGTGDTFGEVAARMMGATRALSNGSGPVAAVSHGGSIRALVTYAMGVSHADRYLVALPANASTTTFDLHGERLELAEFNAVTELPAPVSPRPGG